VWATTWTRILDHCADMNGAPLTRTPPRQSRGRGPSPLEWRRIQTRRSTCLLLLAVQRRRVESLVLRALSSSPVHRALVLVLGTNIAVLLDCSKSSRQCSLPSLLTYSDQVIRGNPASRQVIRGNPASRGTESSAEVLVGLRPGGDQVNLVGLSGASSVCGVTPSPKNGGRRDYTFGN